MVNGITIGGSSVFAPPRLSGVVVRPPATPETPLPKTPEPESPAVRPRTGESGVPGGVRATPASATIHVYALERQHLPAQRRRIEAADLEILDQHVTLKFAFVEGNRVVAVGGRTETTFSSPAGEAPRMLRELAVMSDTASLPEDMRDGLRDPAVVLGMSQKAVPALILLDGYGSALKLWLERQEILARTAPRPIETIREQTGRIRTLFTGATGPLETKLGDLQIRVAGLLDGDAFNARRGESSQPDRVTVETGPSTAPGAYRVEVRHPATAQSVASDSASDRAAALGYSGNILINGKTLVVWTKDSLADLRNLINRGEDANGNGRMDTEDANGNHLLDAGEDLDANGEIDPVEDRNGNRVLDAAETPFGVRARIDDRNRLVLEALRPAETIAFQDPDRILRDLGFAAESPLKELAWKNVLAAPAEGDVTVDGAASRIASNTAEHLIPGATLGIRAATETPATVSVTADTAAAAAAVRGFAENFNGVMETLNGLVGTGGLLTRDKTLQDAWLDLTRNTREPVAGRPAGSDELADIGVAPVRRERLTFTEPAVATALIRLRSDLTGMFDRAGNAPAVAQSLGEIGILHRDDGTLAVDDAVLEKALAEDPSAVTDLFRNAFDGVATRLSRTLSGLLDETTGSLRIRENVLSEIDSGALTESILATSRTHEESYLRAALLLR
ncbi:MAG: flagellar filament capping protein FliD [Planctomycetota bacterium]